MDASSNTLNKKNRAGQTAQFNFILVVGMNSCALFVFFCYVLSCSLINCSLGHPKLN